VSDRVKQLVVLGDGGHTAEIVRLEELLGSDYDYAYVIATSDYISESKIPIEGSVYRTIRPRAKGDRLWQDAWKLVYSFCRAAWLLHRARPDVVLGSGPAVMVPIALLGKLTGAKIIFIETGSRVTALSLTGRIMLRVADLFFVQWEQLQKRYPQTIFAGRLL
jgi:UDP-N-acetylglucosamine:LPS N-acetylglucosamine transferase